jgi:CBS domain-containing protein
VPAADFMTTPVVTTSPGASVRDATRRLLEHRIAALPVVDEQGRLVGIVSELDLLRERVTADPRAHLFPEKTPQRPAPRLVEQVMTRDVYALPDSADAAAFAQLMAESGAKSIPVVQGELLVGIVGRRDLLRLIAREDDAVAADVTALLEADPEVGGWQVAVEDGELTLTGKGTAQQVEAVQLLSRTVPGVVRTRVVQEP